MIVLSHSVSIKCYGITIFGYFFFTMFLVAILSSCFQNNPKPATWLSSTLMDNVIWDFDWLVPGLKINVHVPDSRILKILKSLILDIRSDSYSQKIRNMPSKYHKHWILMELYVINFFKE